MDPEASSGPAQAGIREQVSVIVTEPAWRRLVPRAEAVAARAARAAGNGCNGRDRACRRPNGAPAELPAIAGATGRPMCSPTSNAAAGDRAGARRDPPRGRRRRAQSGASPRPSGGARCPASGRPRPPSRRRGATHGTRRGAHPAPAARAEPVEARMSTNGNGGRASLLDAAAPSAGPRSRSTRCANSIAELVQEAAEAQEERRRAAGAGSPGTRADRQHPAPARDHRRRRDAAARGHRGDAGRRDAGAGAGADPRRRPFAPAGVSRAAR